jgi:hypothetical protein
MGTGYAVKVGPNRQNTVDAIRERRTFSTSGALRGGPSEGSIGMLSPRHREAYYQDAGRIDYVVYSYRTPIAWHVEGLAAGEWYIVDDKFSVTTTYHQSAVRSALL